MFVARDFESPEKKLFYFLSQSNESDRVCQYSARYDSCKVSNICDDYKLTFLYHENCRFGAFSAKVSEIRSWFIFYAIFTKLCRNQI